MEALKTSSDKEKSDVISDGVIKIDGEIIKLPSVPLLSKEKGKQKKAPQEEEEEEEEDLKRERELIAE